MARKFRPQIENTKPKYESLERVISAESVKIEGLVNNVFNEVGTWNLTDQLRQFSQLPGLDPDGRPIRTLTYGSEDPLMIRIELISNYEETAISSTSDIDIAATIGGPNYYYEQDDRVKRRKRILRYERKSRPYITYEEEYFQHIFNWPTEHKMQPRLVGGFVSETNCCDGTVSYYDHSATYPGSTMTLDKVVSELYYVDDLWGYHPLPLNNDGTIQDTDGSLTDKIGEPVIYHGATDDNCLFFHYVVDLEDVNAVGTSNVIVMGDTVNGAVITNVVNYVVEIAIRRTASKSSPKGSSILDITEQQFLSIDPTYTTADYQNSKSWLNLDTANGIGKGNLVVGDGIERDTHVTAVDEVKNRIYLDKPLIKKKIKEVKFIDGNINHVNKNTLCYAQLGGDNIESISFGMDQNYEVMRNGEPTGIIICARAGKGIINRSAIVGIYFSKNKKQVQYEPVFYASDPNCQKQFLEDENGVYVLGTAIWDDNSRSEGKWFLITPKTVPAYRIATTYASFTYGLIDKDTLELFLSQFNSETENYFNVFGNIRNYVRSELDERKIAAVFDDVCRDDLSLDYSLVYDATFEIENLSQLVTEIGANVTDSCTPRNKREDQPTTLDEFQRNIREVLKTSAANSTVLPKQFYESLVSDENSLLNRLDEGIKITKRAIPTKTKIPNSPAQIQGEDKSGINWKVSNFRRLPPAMDRVKFFINDVLTASDREMDPDLDMDPATTINQPRIIIRSKPLWIWNGASTWSNTKTHTGTCGSFTSTFHIDVTEVDGYLDEITSRTGIVTVPPPISCGEAPPCTCTTQWTKPQPKGDDDNVVFGEKSEPWDFSKVSSEQTGYISSINVGLPPELRDLDNAERSDLDDVLAPTASVFPKTLWAPNINYQMDFHKYFWFRMDEISELILEAIDNEGNPYMDYPIRSKLTKTIQPSDTTINVQSTEDFLSSGYLIIPKYYKKLFTKETGNIDSEYTYCGEEIIYYSSKTPTSFEGCERELFGSTSNFEITVPAFSIEVGVRYKILSLGTTNWERCGAGANAEVGTVFIATNSGDGDGTLQVFGSISDVGQSENIDVYEDRPKIPVTSSYETGFSVSQYWVFTIKED